MRKVYGFHHRRTERRSAGKTTTRREKSVATRWHKTPSSRARGPSDVSPQTLDSRFAGMRPFAAVGTYLSTAGRSPRRGMTADLRKVAVYPVCRAISTGAGEHHRVEAVAAVPVRRSFNVGPCRARCQRAQALLGIARREFGMRSEKMTRRLLRSHPQDAARCIDDRPPASPASRPPQDRACLAATRQRGLSCRHLRSGFRRRVPKPVQGASTTRGRSSRKTLDLRVALRRHSCGTLRARSERAALQLAGAGRRSKA